VNSGRCLGQRELEETALKTNLEAADEVARQLRLRDLGGLVVIDFIDLKDRKHQKEVEQALKQALKKDKARVTVGPLSKFGLMELSRQRLRPAAETSAFTDCPACHGRGRLKTVDTLGLSLLRQISAQVVQNPVQEVRATVPVEVSNFLLNQKRKGLLALEEQFSIRIILTGKEGLGPEEIQVEYLKREAAEPKPAPESKAAPEPTPETKPTSEAKPSRAPRKRPSRPRRRAAKPKPPAEPPPADAKGA
jgi:ribonuclease E